MLPMQRVKINGLLRTKMILLDGCSSLRLPTEQALADYATFLTDLKTVVKEQNIVQLSHLGDRMEDNSLLIWGLSILTLSQGEWKSYSFNMSMRKFIALRHDKVNRQDLKK